MLNLNTKILRGSLDELERIQPEIKSMVETLPEPVLKEVKAFEKKMKDAIDKGDESGMFNVYSDLKDFTKQFRGK